MKTIKPLKAVLKKYSAVFGICFFVFASIVCKSQCPSGGVNIGSIVPTTAWQTIPVEAGQYLVFEGDPCSKFVFSFCQGGGTSAFDTEITITDSLGNIVPDDYDNNACGLQSEIGFVPLYEGPYRVYVTLYNCVASGGAGSILAYNRVDIFNTGPNYVCVNAAVSSAPYTCVVLTPDVGGLSGCAWDANSTLNFGANFLYDFFISLGYNDGGADGMCFVMQNDPRGRCALGLQGGNIGAGKILNSLIVEIDTYLNDEDRDDGMAGVLCTGGPEPDHLDIWLNGNLNPAGGLCPGSPGARVIPAATALMNGATPYNIENGTSHLLRVAWVSATTTFSASIYDLSGTTLFGTVTYVFDPLIVFGTTTPFFGFTAATGFNSNQQVFCNPATLLPIELLSFEGKAEGKKNVLKWTTVSETNNNFFSVQRSSTAKDFVTIGTVKGAGTSNQSLQYSFVDTKPLPHQNYYRLLQNDFDGSTSFSRIISIKNSAAETATVTVFPNPAETFLSIVSVNDIDNSQIEIVNVLGETVLKKSFQNNLDVSILSSGVYFLKIKTGQQIYSAKFVKR